MILTMELKPSFMSAFLVIFLVMAASKEVIIKVEGRGEFRCPKMIECKSVCQGYPNCCVNGQCLCEPCRTLLPQPLESSSPPEN
ncbi:hypothetical protein CsatB_019942 [Cannabis sativa]